MEPIYQPHGPHLFIVRLWRESVGEGRTEVRGKVQHVLSGEVRYFRDWSTLIALLTEMMARTAGEHPDMGITPRRQF